VVVGEGGLLDFMREGTLFVDMSTSSRSWPGGSRGRRRAEVSGCSTRRSRAAMWRRSRMLSIMAGGEEEDFMRASPFFEAMGDMIMHVGESGAGQVTKAANQIVVALVLEAVSEALVLGSKAGVEPAKLIEVLSGGLAANRAMEVKRDKLLGHDFGPGGKVEFHHKDLGIALEAGRGYGVALPVAALVGSDVRRVEGQGKGRLGPLRPAHLDRGAFRASLRHPRLKSHAPAKRGFRHRVSGRREFDAATPPLAASSDLG
jgi:2-hydroxy-3-oxopropionate reductase